MNGRVKLGIAVGIIIVALFLVWRLDKAGIKILPSSGGQESTATGPLNYVPQVALDWLKNQGAVMLPGKPVDPAWMKELQKQFPNLAGLTGTSQLYYPPATISTGESAAGAPTYTPTPTTAPTRTPTPIVLRPMTGTVTIAFPPASMLVMKGNENSLQTKMKVGGKSFSSSYWVKFDGSCGSLWCRGPLQVVVPITGTFTLPPTLVIVNGEVNFQAADVGSNYDLANLSFDVSLNAPTSKDMKFGDETGVTEFWAVGKTGNDLVLIKVRIQRWDAMNLQFTPLEMVVSFKAGDDIPGFVKLAVAPTMTPTATQPAARNTPTRTPTRSR